MEKQTVVLSRIRADLKAAADEKTRTSGMRFFKEEVKLYGVKTPTVSKLAKKYWAEVEGMDKEKIFGLCESLLGTGYMEESIIAANWAYFLRKRYEPSDFPVFESWVDKYVTNWATCDTLCNHAAGEYVERFPERVNDLKRWAKSKNMWMRRAAAVTLILPARRGLFLKEVFEIADILLKDEEDLVQKGYGWMLKAASKKHLKEVYGYVMENKEDMPRTALRYAIEKMPAEMKKRAME